MADHNVMLDADELSETRRLLEEHGHGKDGGDYEPECPICTAADKFAAALASATPQASPQARTDVAQAFYETLREYDPTAHPDPWDNLAQSWRDDYARMAAKFLAAASPQAPDARGERK